jgi:hypothetical protein
VRISDRLLVQRVDDLIVIVDESSGAEITFPVAEVALVTAALMILRDPFTTGPPVSLAGAAPYVWRKCSVCQGQAEVVFNESGDPQRDEADPCPNPACDDGYVLSP